LAQFLAVEHLHRASVGQDPTVIDQQDPVESARLLQIVKRGQDGALTA